MGVKLLITRNPAGIESHGGNGKEFNNYVMESKEYLSGTNIYCQIVTKNPSFGDALI